MRAARSAICRKPRRFLCLGEKYASQNKNFFYKRACPRRSDIAFYKTAQTVQGEIAEFVSDSEGSQHPIVRYTVDGKAYRVRLNSYSASMRAGDAYTMYYAPDAPHQARNKTYLGGTIFLSIGSGFFLFGAGGLCRHSAYYGGGMCGKCNRQRQNAVLSVLRNGRSACACGQTLKKPLCVCTAFAVAGRDIGSGVFRPAKADKVSGGYRFFAKA